MRKLLVSRRFPIALLIILNFYLTNFSQTETYSVSAKWELYSVKDKDVSFLMPRLPVLIEQKNECMGEASQNYAAYHDGAAYVVKITSKVNTPEYCVVRKGFDDSNFTQRIKYIKKELKDESKTENKFAPDAVIKLKGAGVLVKLINDYKNKRWIEFATYGADEKKDEAIKFLASFNSDNTAAGIEIGQGAERTFGDDSGIIEDFEFEKDGKTEIGKRMSVRVDDAAVIPARIILKPRSNYTEAARKNQVQGKVVLKVTFQANGAIGDVTVVSGLKFGLTEEAIKAARRIVFIPPQRDGVRYSVTKWVEYTFTIY